jgi:hypothetical protein
VLFVDMAGGARTIKVVLHLLRNGHDRDHALVAPTRGRDAIVMPNTLDIPTANITASRP